MELDQLYVHVELCEALLEDFLQRPDLLQEQSNLEGLLLVAESLLAYLVQIEALIPAVYPRIQVLVNGVIGCTREAAQSLEYILQCHQRQENNQIRGRGRPKLQFSEGQLVELLHSHFSIVDIANLFGCSTRTVHRRIHEFGLAGAVHSNISDRDLDSIVEGFVQAHPRSGQRLLVGHLRSLGLRLPRWRARNSLLRVDPHGVASRLRQALHRRQYSVPGPNSLWHVDGHHKYIRWKIVIHGGIDGFSREIVYLKAAANNRSETVLSMHFYMLLRNMAYHPGYEVTKAVRMLGFHNIC